MGWLAEEKRQVGEKGTFASSAEIPSDRLARLVGSISCRERDIRSITDSAEEDVLERCNRILCTKGTSPALKQNTASFISLVAGTRSRLGGKLQCQRVRCQSNKTPSKRFLEIRERSTLMQKSDVAQLPSVSHNSKIGALSGFGTKANKPTTSLPLAQPGRSSRLFVAFSTPICFGVPTD